MKGKLFSRNKGYTLLFAIIVASIVLSIAAFILQASRKQIVLSTVNRDSILAIYAADSAIQCMVQSYYEGLLSTSTVEQLTGNVVPRNAQVNCLGFSDDQIFTDQNFNGQGYNLKTDNGYSVSYLAEPLYFDFNNDTCALGYVYDGYDSTTGKHKTIIEVRGYNNKFSKPCNDSVDAIFNPRTVERAIRLVYTD